MICFLGLTFICLSILVSVQDFKSSQIPTFLTISLAVGGFLSLWLIMPGLLIASLVTVSIIGASLFLATNWLYARTGTDYLGLGDIKLISALTLWVGPFGIAPSLLISSLSGLLFLVIMRRRQLPFGPFLCLGFLLVWLHDNAAAIFPAQT